MRLFPVGDTSGERLPPSPPPSLPAKCPEGLWCPGKHLARGALGCCPAVVEVECKPPPPGVSVYALSCLPALPLQGLLSLLSWAFSPRRPTHNCARKGFPVSPHSCASTPITGPATASREGQPMSRPSKGRMEQDQLKLEGWDLKQAVWGCPEGQERPQKSRVLEGKKLWGWQETEGPSKLVKTGGCQVK